MWIFDFVNWADASGIPLFWLSLSKTYINNYIVSRDLVPPKIVFLVEFSFVLGESIATWSA
jgi:hypothetical protein